MHPIIRAISVWIVVVATIGSVRAEQSVQLREEIAKPLKEAQSAIGHRQWAEAQSQLDVAASVQGLTDTERFTIDRLRGYVFYAQKDYRQAIPVYRRLVESGQLPQKDTDERAKAVASMYFQLGDYRQCVDWYKSAFQSRPADSALAATVANAYFKLREWRNAADNMERAVGIFEGAHRKPPEEWLRLIERSYYNVHDVAGDTGALRELVRYYQKPDDWNLLIRRSISDMEDKELLFGYRRLMSDLGLLKTHDEFENAFFAALDAKMPAEAQRLLEQGRRAGVFGGAGSPPGRYERLQKALQQQLGTSEQSLDAMSKEAAATPSGQDDVKLGDIFLSYGRYDDAINLLRRGLAQGALNDMDAARLTLGIAREKDGQSDQARKDFAAVDKQSKWAGLAELWSLRTASTAG